ncbi:MAG TPA: NAD(+) synthase, partial [Thermoanaerobaculia bacterium]|nr:NAD(+) synthase [Thermoanaerobaculia bacterium]
VLCLPELCITGYGCEDAFLSPAVADTAWEVLHEIVPQTRGIVVAVGLPVLFRNALFNCAALLADGRILGFVAKQNLPGDGLHYEPRWFKAWPRGVSAELERGEQRWPLGDLVFDVGGVGIGFEICEDAWVGTRPGAMLARKGIDLLLNPSASHFAFGKREVRERFVIEGSRAFGVSYVYTNLLGNEAGRAIYDGGGLVATAGRLVANGPRLTFGDRQITSAVVDLDFTRMNQARLWSFSPELEERPGTRVRAAFRFPEAEAEETGAQLAAWEHSEHLKEEELTRAVGLALFDYLRKSGARSFVVSLSGGADSTAVSCLVALMVELGWDELGREHFLDRLGLGAIDADTPREAIRELLTCVYQSTCNSSSASREAAQVVAEALGARFYALDVDDLVDAYTRLVEDAAGRPLDWDHDDLALQNIQARVRAPSVWMLANLRRGLLLATSDRSEAAVGYATMDGDTAGGLAPIAGIDKPFLRQWLRWLETAGPAGLHPIAALAAVTAQDPTPELRPPGAKQTAEADLMPYEVLDAIEQLAIGDKKSPLEVYRLLRPRFEQHPPAQVAAWVERFYRLFARNQWKRERYAPSFHVDDLNLDPKTWFRFPILSGGYEREIEALRQAVAVEAEQRAVRAEVEPH